LRNLQADRFPEVIGAGLEGQSQNAQGFPL
jgi:hypothetical protein